MTPRQTLDHLRKAQQVFYEVQAMSAGIAALLELSMPTTKGDGIRIAHADTIAGLIETHIQRGLDQLVDIEEANTVAAREVEA